MNCKICGKYTESIFNINFKKVYICESCANTITSQQIDYLINTKTKTTWSHSSTSTTFKLFIQVKNNEHQLISVLYPFDYSTVENYFDENPISEIEELKELEDGFYYVDFTETYYKTIEGIGGDVDLTINEIRKLEI